MSDRGAGAIRGFGDFVGTRTVANRPNWGMATLEIEPRHLNRLDIVHGGVILTLLDHACGAALTHGSSKELGKAAVTVSLNATFLRAARSGKLYGIGRCIKRGQSIAFCEAVIEDETGAAIAKASGSFKLIR